MGLEKYITSKERQDIANLFSSRNIILEIVKILNRNHRTIEKEIENIGQITNRK